jgi:hypothetical protein
MLDKANLKLEEQLKGQETKYEAIIKEIK